MAVSQRIIINFQKNKLLKKDVLTFYKILLDQFTRGFFLIVGPNTTVLN